MRKHFNRILALLETFELNNVRVPRISGHSKGMRQKIMMSAALLHDPDVLWLDEPLSGLSFGLIPLRDIVGKVRQVYFSSGINGILWERIGVTIGSS